MINILASDNNWYNQQEIVMLVIHDMLKQGHVTIQTNEAPCFKTNGLYDLLDKICSQFDFDPGKITIITGNPYESSDRYQIKYSKFNWCAPAVKNYFLSGFDRSQFENKKDLTQNRFGSFNNRPTWYRLCLVNYLLKKPVPSVVSCNTSWDETSPNRIPFDSLATHVPQQEYFEIMETIKRCPIQLPCGPITQEQKETVQGFEKTLTSLMPLYNSFFVDVIGVTFTVGDTFYLDEKEARPMLCLTPFIVYGTNGHLESMRGHGFKTFDRWWDESYDQYSGHDRLKKIYKVIDDLAQKSLTELQQMYQDMLPTLQHNYNHLIAIYGQ